MKANCSSEKIYHSIYQEFINSLVLPKPYLDHIYDSKYTRHFYTTDEICAFSAKWSTNSAWAVEGDIN
ncbi:MAG: hypothetical protein KDJ52_34000 [Anaerolineae bacterium]|nr:hypothetical protein [Anaerolineae bacterium]